MFVKHTKAKRDRPEPSGSANKPYLKENRSAQTVPSGMSLLEYFASLPCFLIYK